MRRGGVQSSLCFDKYEVLLAHWFNGGTCTKCSRDEFSVVNQG